MSDEVFPLSFILAAALAVGSMWLVIRLGKMWKLRAKGQTSHVLLVSVLSVVFSGITLVGLFAEGQALNSPLLLITSVFFFWIAMVALTVGAWWTAFRLAAVWKKDITLQALLGIVLGIAFSAIVVGGAFAGCAAMSPKHF